MIDNERRALTAARGVAAWLVVLFHVRASLPGLPPTAMRLFDKGYLAVDFFFLLSGFVLWLGWHDRLDSRHAVAAFWWRRVRRIWPLHLMTLGGTVALALVTIVAGHATTADYRFADLPLHLLLVQGWGWTDPLQWNDPAWSISAECVAYLLFPLMVMAVDWRRLSTPVLSVAGAMPLMLLGWAMRDQSGLGADVARFGVLRCCTEFATGTIVAALWQRGTARWAPVVLIAAVASASLGLPEAMIAPAACAAIVAWVAGLPQRGRIIHYLGEISYATYLSHWLIWKLVKLAFVRNLAAVPATVMIGYLLLVLAASIALHEGVDRRPVRGRRQSIRQLLRPVPRPAPQ